MQNNTDSESRHEQAILYTDKSPHYTVSHISKNTKGLNYNAVEPHLKCEMRFCNVQELAKEIDAVKATDDEEPQISYSEYNTFLSLKYNRRFS